MDTKFFISQSGVWKVNIELVKHITTRSKWIISLLSKLKILCKGFEVGIVALDRWEVFYDITGYTVPWWMIMLKYKNMLD